MTEQESAELCMMLAAAYPSWRPTVPTLRLYSSALAPLPVEVAREATIRIIRSDREFPPPVGVIWTEAVKLIQAAEGRPHIAAEDAWSEVRDKMRQLGIYKYPTWSHPTIEEAVEAIGWRDLCLTENIVATRAHFFRIFEAKQRRAFEDFSFKLVAERNPELANLTRNLIEKLKA
jgi:hypothetical protein